MTAAYVVAAWGNCCGPPPNPPATPLWNVTIGGSSSDAILDGIRRFCCCCWNRRTKIGSDVTISRVMETSSIVVKQDWMVRRIRCFVRGWIVWMISSSIGIGIVESSGTTLFASFGVSVWCCCSLWSIPSCEGNRVVVCTLPSKSKPCKHQ